MTVAADQYVTPHQLHLIPSPQQHLNQHADHVPGVKIPSIIVKLMGNRHVKLHTQGGPREIVQISVDFVVCKIN